MLFTLNPKRPGLGFTLSYRELLGPSERYRAERQGDTCCYCLKPIIKLSHPRLSRLHFKDQGT